MSKKTKRMVTVTDLQELASGIITRSKNGPRCLLRRLVDNGGVVEVHFSDIPADSVKFQKILQHEKDSFWGIYDSKAKPEWIISDCSVKV